MRAGIATLTAHPFGALVLDCDDKRSNLGEIKRRVTRMATLDLGAALIDQGYTDADRTITLVLHNPSADTVSSARAIVQGQAVVLLFLQDGAYRAAPEQITESPGAVTLRFLLAGAAEVAVA
jgi:hypothetical protein